MEKGPLCHYNSYEGGTSYEPHWLVTNIVISWFRDDISIFSKVLLMLLPAGDLIHCHDKNVVENLQKEFWAIYSCCAKQTAIALLRAAKKDLGPKLSSIFRPNLFLIFISMQYFDCLVSTSFAIYLFLRFCFSQYYRFPEKTCLTLLPLLVKQWTARYTCT